MSVDMQRQRLRHLVSSAVHELWKKETGSVSSVLIEGTICITVHGGRTTVVQLAEHYSGLIPESVGCRTTEATGNAEDDANGRPDEFGESKSDGSRSLIVSPSRNGFGGGHDDVFCDENGAAVERLGYLARKYSPIHHGRMATPMNADMDTNNNQKGVVDAESNARESRRLLSGRHGGFDDEDSTEIDVDDEEDIRSTSSNDEGRFVDDRQRVVSRIHDDQRFVSGYSGTAVELEDSANDSAVQDMSISFETSRLSSSGRPDGGCGSAAEDLRSPLSVSRRLSVSHQETSANGVLSSPPSCGLDNGTDLLLSSPQDLTAQVRNVIRQRLIKQLSPFEALHQGVVAAAAAATNGAIGHQPSSSSFVRPHSSPYYRPMPSPLYWSTPVGSGNSGTRESPSESARRMMTSSFGTAPSSSLTSPINQQSQMQAHHQHHRYLMSPNSSTPASGTTPVGVSGSSSSSAAAAAMQFGASLHNLLGMRAAAVAAVAAAAAGGQTLDLKMRGGAVATSPISGGGSSNASASSGAMIVAGGDLPMTAADGTGSTSDPQKIYRCDYCFKTFLFKSKYHEHLPVHTSARPFQCHLCTRTYKYKYDLRVHLRTHLGIPTKSTVCPFCAGRFATNKLLRQHMRSAHSDNQVTTTSNPAMGSDVKFSVGEMKTEMKSEMTPPPSSAPITAVSGSSSLAMSDGSSSIDDSTSRMSSDAAERKGSVDDEVDCDDVAAAGPVSGAVVEKLTVDAVS